MAGAEKAEITTHLHVPKSVDVPLGSTADITVTVTAHSGRVPVGTVSLWDVDIPDSATIVSHTVTLNGQGKATFQVREHLPGVPFRVKQASVYFVPKRGSGFAPSTSRDFVLGMHQWPASVSVSLGRKDGKGRAVPLTVSVSSSLAGSGSAESFPVGDLSISDVSNGSECKSEINGALLYGSSGKAKLDVDLPAGKNRLGVTYLGDAYFGAQTPVDSSVNITTGARASGTCPANWARLASHPYVPPLSGADIPMYKYGFPRNYGQYNLGALANPDAGILVVQLDWSDIEPAAGKFDFTKADREVQSAISHGKRVALLLRFQAGLSLSGTSNSCGWNYGHAQLLPRWVGEALGATDSFCSHGTALTIPKYWGAPFLALWRSCVDAVAAHFAPYAADIAYVRAPVGLGDEAKAITGPNSTPTKKDLNQLLSWGYNPQLWEAWQEDMLSYYRKAFSYSPWVLYTINHQDINDKCTDPVPVIPTFLPRAISCSGRSVEVDVGEWAVDNGFGLAQNSLDSSWIWRNPNKDDPPAGNVNTIFAYAMRHTPHPLIELQTFEAQSYWCKLDVPSGIPPCHPNSQAFLNTEQDISYARSHGVDTIEWYEDDLANPKLEPVIDLWRQLRAVPGHGKVPTVVTATPAQSSAKAGSKVHVVITVGAPGIAGFIPGGTVLLSDDITGRHLKSVQIGPDTGTAKVTVKIPRTTYGHVNLAASYFDRFAVGKTKNGTDLWLPSESSITRISVK